VLVASAPNDKAPEVELVGVFPGQQQDRLVRVGHALRAVDDRQQHVFNGDSRGHRTGNIVERAEQFALTAGIAAEPGPKTANDAWVHGGWTQRLSPTVRDRGSIAMVRHPGHV